MVRRMSMIFALVAAVLVAAGCGTTTGGTSSANKFTGEEKAVATTVEKLESDGSKSNATDICKHVLSASLVATIAKASGKKCSTAIDKTLKDTDVYDLSVLDKGVTITGTKAIARVRSKAGDESDISILQLVKEAGRWKISEIGPAQDIKG